MTGGPFWWARRVVALDVHVLPAGRARERYRQEFLADLFGMSRRQSTAYLLGILANRRRLRAAVVGSVPLSCRLSLRHRWRICSTEDGGRYKECSRCLKEYPGWEYYLWRYPGDNIGGSFGA